MPIAVSGNRPSDEQCLYIGTFAPATENAEYRGNFARYHVRLAADRLWLAEDLCIPLNAIRTQCFIQGGLLLKRHALRIVFINPVSGAIDAAYLCDIDFMGFYYRSRLVKFNQALSAALEPVRANEPIAAAPKDDAVYEPPPRPTYYSIIRDSFFYLFARRESLEKEYCIQLIRALNPGVPVPELAEDDLRRKVRLALMERQSRNGRVDFSALLEKAVVVWRIFAFWNFAWLVFLPLYILTNLMFRNPPQHFDAKSIGFLLLYNAAGYLILMLIAGTLSAMLTVPFVVTMNALFGLDIQILPGRRY